MSLLQQRLGIAMLVFLLVGFLVPCTAMAVEDDSIKSGGSHKHKTKTDRFTDMGDGTIRDNDTGLFWLKNANCFGGMRWNDAMNAAADLTSGECGLYDGSAATDWRVPTRGDWDGFVCDGGICNGHETSGWPHGPCPWPVYNRAGDGCASPGDPFIGLYFFKFVASHPSNSMIPIYWSSTIHTQGVTSAPEYRDLGTDGGAYWPGNPDDFCLVWPVRNGIN